MKIRTDYVTNSSSSSFILGFKSEKDIERTLEKELANYRNVPMYENEYYDDENLLDVFRIVCDDCLSEKLMTLEEVLDQAYDELEIRTKWALEDRVVWSKLQAYKKSEQFQKDFDELMTKKLNLIKENAKGSKVFVRVTYGDELSVIEHEILPYIPCCIAQFSHH